MPRHWTRCFNKLAWACVALTVVPSQAAHVDTVQASIGILAFRGADFATDLWQPLVQYLNKAVPGHTFNVVPVTLDDIKARVENKQLDFVLTNAASYSELEARYGASRITTLRWRRGDKTYSQFGAVIFTRRDNTSIQRLEDLRGSHFMAVHPEAFGGWWMARWELQNVGILPSDLSKLSFSGFPQDDVVYAVRERVAEAGTVRSGVLEAMAAKGLIDLNEFRVLNPQPRDEYPLLHSTRLYPEWAFAMLRHTHSDLAREVAVALLSAPEIPIQAIAGESVGWTVPLDYKPVLDMMHDLRVGPFAGMEPTGSAPFLTRHWWWLTLALLAGLVTVAVALFVTHLVRRLVETRRQADHHNQRIQALQQLAASSELSWQEQLEQAIATGCALFRADFGIVSAVSDGAESCIVEAAAGDVDATQVRGKKTALSRNVTGAICAGGRPVALADITADVWKSFPDSPGRTARSLIATPFRVLGKVSGTLELYRNEPRTTSFTAGDDALTQLLAHWIAAAYERKLAAKAVLPTTVGKKDPLIPSPAAAAPSRQSDPA